MLGGSFVGGRFARVPFVGVAFRFRLGSDACEQGHGAAIPELSGLSP
jgi:hypothetical protein